MAAYEKAHIDEIASNQWPHWIPIRHHFGIETFGINLWRGQRDGTLIPEHDHGEDGEPELYYTVDGHATFTIAGEEVDAPAGTCVWVSEAATKRTATANATGALVLSIGAARPARHTCPRAGSSDYLEATSSPELARYARNGAAGPGGPAGLQNPYGRATHG